MSAPIDKLLFTAASGFPNAADRRDFLAFACRDDEPMRKRIEELLEIMRDAEDFFEFQPEMTAPTETAHAAEVAVVDHTVDESRLGATIGPYQLIERIGAGGCGVVYLAEQHQPVKRKVALKIIRLGMDTENVIARFEIERESLALMDHPNIARVLDAGSTGAGRPYFVMELVDGEKVTEFCDHKRLTIRQRLELFVLVCEAIQHAHQKGVIHRDIKPSNVLVRQRENRVIPKVIDFGIAKATGEHREAELTFTAAGQLIGTPAYMSPEQADGGMDADTRCDIYSLGALLYELLTGHPPYDLSRFKECTVDEIREIIRTEDPVPPSELLRHLPVGEQEKIAAARGTDMDRLSPTITGDLDWIVMKTLEKDRGRRYETANGLAMDVVRYLNEEPVLARPTSRRYRMAKMVKRNRVSFAAGTIAISAILAGFGVSTWLFLREKDAREQQAGLRNAAELARANEAKLRERAESGALVAQAAVLLNDGDFQRADEKLARVPVDRTPASREAALTFKALADWHLEQGHQAIAADRLNSLAIAISAVDVSDTDRVSWNLLPASSALAELDDPTRYETFRQQAITRFAKSTNPLVAQQVLKACLILPADQKMLDALAPLTRVVQRAHVDSGSNIDAGLAAWRTLSLALYELRKGDTYTAAGWAHQSLAYNLNHSTLKITARLILAICDFHQGRAAKAREAIEDLRSLVKAGSLAPFKSWDPREGFWFDWVNARILLKEADGLLGIPSTGKSETTRETGP